VYLEKGVYSVGYYSFYKIIKDIIHTIFGRKFFRLLLIILIIMCLCSPVFAYDFYSEKLDYTFTLPDDAENNYSYFFIDKNYSDSKYFYYFTSTTPIEVSSLDVTNSDGSVTNYYLFSPSNNGDIIGYSSVVTNWSSLDELNNVLSAYYKTTDDFNSIKFRPEKFFNFDYRFVSSDVELPNGTVYKATDGLVPNSNPHFSNADDLSDYDFNNMYINMGSFGVDDVAYLHKLEVDRTFEDDTGVIYYKQSVFKLHSDSDYYGITNDLVSYYSIPRSALNLSSDKEYLFVLNDNASSINATNGLYSDSSAYDILHLEPANSVITPEKEQNDAIKGNTDAINKLENTINSNDYDENQIQIDSSLSDNIDDNNYTNFITEIINSINNAITCDWNTVETVQIPLGFVDESIIWKSDLLSAHVPQSLKLIINTFWMFLFGFYIFKFSLSLVNWLKSGEILDGKGFNSDEVITSNML